MRLHFDTGGSRVRSVHISAGKLGRKGAKRGTTWAGEQVGVARGIEAKKRGREGLRRIVRGTGRGRLSVAKGRLKVGVPVVSMSDATRVPHGGCRPKKKRRV